MAASKELLQIIKNLINEELKKMDKTELCQIVSVNNDGTLNIYVFPDLVNIIPNIINASKYTFQQGDIAVLYKIKNQIGNSFVIAKYNPVGGEN